MGDSMLYLLMAACTGGPDKTHDSGSVVDVENLVITEFGATIEGEPSRTVDVYVKINEDSTSCQMNLEVNNCYGVVFDTLQIPNVSHVKYELTEGVCLNVSAGDTTHTTSFGAPTHLEGATTFFSNPLDVGEEETEVVIDLTWYLSDTDDAGDHVSYYCWADGYWWIDGDWELDEEQYQLSGGPFVFNTLADGELDGDYGVFGPEVWIVGGQMTDRSDGITLHDTWQSSDGISFGVTSEASSFKDVITCIDRSTL